MDDFAISLSALDAEVKSPERMLAQLRYDVDRETAERSDIIRTVDDGRNEERWTDDAGNMPIVIGEGADMAVGLLSAEQVDLGGGASLKAVDGRVGTAALAIGDSGVLGSIVGGAGEVFSDNAGNEPVGIDAGGRLAAESFYTEKFALGSAVMTDAGGAISLSGLDVGGIWQTQIVTGYPADEIFADAAGNIKIAIYADRVLIDGIEQEAKLDPAFSAWIDGDGLHLYRDAVGTGIVATGAVKGFDFLADRIRYLVTENSVIVRKEMLLAFPTSFAGTVTHVAWRLMTGQSNSVGAANNGVETPNALLPGYATMFAGGPFSTPVLSPVGATFEYILDVSSMAAIVDAREAIRAGATSGETGATRMAAKTAGYLGNTKAVLTGSTGIPGRSETDWGETTGQIFKNSIAATRRAQLFAAMKGLTFDADYIHLVAGEADGPDGYDTYYGDLGRACDNFRAAWLAMGLNAPIVVANQYSSYGGSATTPLVPVRFALEHPDKLVCIGALYDLMHDADGVHLSPVAQAIRGERAAWYEQQHRLGLAPKPAYLNNPVRTGATITVDVEGLLGNLVEDIVSVTRPELQSGGKGIKGIEFGQTGGNTVTVLSAAVTGAKQLTITLSAVPTGTSQWVSSAWYGIPSTNGGPLTGPRCNFRDSTAMFVASVNSQPQYKWLCHDRVFIS